jgi:hypothetical protein
MNIKPILTTKDIPDTKDSKFWNNVDNPDIKGYILYQIMEEIRAVNVNALTESNAKAILCMLVAKQRIIDGSANLITSSQQQLDLHG